MRRIRIPGTILLALLALLVVPIARADSPLTADVLRAGLRTADPASEAYITYIATLLQQNRLPQDLVSGVFRWTQRKPASARAEYFKQGLIVKAREIGITLPTGTPSLTGTIRGRILVAGVLFNTPASFTTVTIDGSRRRTTTDINGNFAFEDLPLGTYTLRAEGTAAGLITVRAAETAMLPSDPPSNDVVTVRMMMR
jgi:hypothetical protein